MISLFDKLGAMLAFGNRRGKSVFGKSPAKATPKTNKRPLVKAARAQSRRNRKK